MATKVTITADGITVDAPIVAGELIVVTASGLDLADGAALALTLSAKRPNVLLCSVELEKDEESGEWAGTMQTASNQMSLYFATASADEARPVVLELIDTAHLDSLALLATTARNSRLIPALSPCAVNPVYLSVPGEKGEPGAAATVQVGTVSTLDAGAAATVTNTGTENAAILDFGIPKGATGKGGLAFVKGTTYLWSPLANSVVHVSGSAIRQYLIDASNIRGEISEGETALFVFILTNTGTESRDIFFFDGSDVYVPPHPSSLVFSDGVLSLAAGETRTIIAATTSFAAADFFIVGAF